MWADDYYKSTKIIWKRKETGEGRKLCYEGASNRNSEENKLLCIKAANGINKRGQPDKEKSRL
jgi:hypothetical protein